MSKAELVSAVDQRIREELEKKFVEIYKAEKVAFGKAILENGRIDLFCTEILGYTLKWFHKQMIRFQERNPFCLILAPRGTGKCLCGESLITLTNGQLVPAKDIEVGDHIISYNQNDMCFENDVIISKEDTGIKECFVIETQFGREIVQSKDHRILTNHGWKKTDELTLGDFLIGQNLEGYSQSIDIINAPIRYEKIIKITKRKDVSTYDFQVQKNENLIANGLITHNSTICTVARAIYELRKNPNIRILIVSNTQSQASVYLREIKNHFEGNELFHLTYGELKGEKWSDKEIDVKDRKSHEKEHNVTCVGVGGPVVGRHYDLILFDDLVDEENARTQLQRERLKIWFYKALLPTLMPVTGRAMGVGTRYYPNDLYGDIIKNNPEFKWGIWPAIIERDGKRESIWPEMLPLELLENKKRAMGVALFNSQYMNDVEAMEGKIFNFEDFKFYKVLPEKVRIFQGVDLAIAENETSCYFVIATIAKDEYNNIYIIDIHRTKASFLKQTNLIEQKFHQFNPFRVYIEANAYQRAQVQNLLANTEVRVKPIITLKDKVTRAWHIAHRFESGQVFFPEYGMQDFMDELLSFPDGDYDDQFDAFEIAVSGSKKGRKKERRDFGLL